MTASGDWRRVSRDRPCPICQHDSWCTVAADGSVVCCMRVESPKWLRNGGWLHRLHEGDGRRYRPYVRRVALPNASAPAADFAALARKYRAAVEPAACEALAAELGVRWGGLWRLGIGWDGGAWTFPMSDAGGHIVGIRRRLPDGRKLSVRGGHEGLFIPAELPASGLLLVTEGPTDCAALLGLGFACIGRPSCTGGRGLIVDLMVARGFHDVVIVADRDKPKLDGRRPGQDGAAELAHLLRPFCEQVRVILPPTGSKDARAWVKGGATRADIEAAIDTASPVRLTVSSHRVRRTVRHD